ncbi:hypothetical protein SADUNF_Sadunf15G0095500 [Salix dunnii]|uniref:Uncharacterized protein n=1 Tax=Salix dunnii TaxID=1413687 RepID=A0A835MP28_9ROSI|nr:hypothetical protein SADUNF_Sadunf15G0095500 [Salix dunnii]
MLAAAKQGFWWRNWFCNKTGEAPDKRGLFRSDNTIPGLGPLGGGIGSATSNGGNEGGGGSAIGGGSDSSGGEASLL